jgi:hypothetical protein
MDGEGATPFPITGSHVYTNERVLIGDISLITNSTS